MKAASINHIFRLVWSDHLQGFVAVPEGTRSRGKRGGGRALTRAAGAVLAVLAASQASAAGLPTGGQIAQGTGSISQAGNTLTVNQTSSKLLTNWQSFSVGAGNTVNFVQPGASAVALNNVLGSDVSVIQGAINANGQVFLLNPNGVLFTPTAQVNVGSLVASTLTMSTSDFMAGNYRFSGASANAVVNQGNIVATGDGSAGGSIALIAAKITNDGSLTAKGGNVLLGAGSDVTLDLGGPVQLQVNKGAIDALVANGGAIQADGGVVYLTAQALDTLTSAVINNTGVIRAQTLATGAKGDIRLIADMRVGTVNVGGTLDASAPQGGDGGFIETSGANVATAADAIVKAGSAAGNSGQWLLDPTDVTISTGTDSGYTNNAGTYTPNTGASTAVVSASTINAALNGDTSVTVVTTSSGTGNGDITVSAPITKSAGTGSPTLTLQADRNITVSAPITATAGKLNIDLSAANNAAGTFGGIDITANLASHGGNILIGGAGGSLTAARTVSNGIGYALDYSASMPAVTLNPGTASSVSVLSGGGNITINGYSTTTPSGNGDGAGVHLFAGSVVDSGNYANGSGSAPVAGGNINISGYALGAGQFGIKFDQNTGQSAFKTTVATSPVNGTIVLDGNNPGNSQYALGLSNAGNQGNLYFAAYSTADLLVLVNGSASVAAFQAVPPNSGCRVGYPNCGTFSVPGANGSYPDATFNAVVWSANNIYITGSVAGSKTYDGSANATGLTATGLTCSGALLNCTQSSLTTAGLWNFTTASPNAGSYSVISPTTSTYTTGSPATNYQLGYFFLSGTYQINPAPLG
ncbi:MAG: filamentous hemagglutinin N-terminal domain-containing protein, partial [Burkholderiales bacterium]|nr:filamentous hemagglutinin N-terminal domain-containing protein [Burkholderiales bacterium]